MAEYTRNDNSTAQTDSSTSSLLKDAFGWMANPEGAFEVGESAGNAMEDSPIGRFTAGGWGQKILSIFNNDLVQSGLGIFCAIKAATSAVKLNAVDATIFGGFAAMLLGGNTQGAIDGFMHGAVKEGTPQAPTPAESSSAPPLTTVSANGNPWGGLADASALDAQGANNVASMQAQNTMSHEGNIFKLPTLGQAQNMQLAS